MAYTVLARKYRSRTFGEVIGQEPIATTLGNAIRTGRIHHGYLFTGTRGTGKTSMARILAKSLNCLKFDAPTTTPCCACDACRLIGEGADLDVIEIDAASNTGVENIRELRSNTAYMPARSRFKIYIIDEVHMLSTGAFNALLKTLEEPPEHVKFILATTEIQKVPATIQSRCQRFNFRHISPQDIAARLVAICKEEGTKADDAVLRRVARLANGSMRDALSILDQLLSVSPQELSAAVLDELLPPAQNERVLALLRQAAAGDAAAALAELDRIASDGRGLEVFCSDAIDTVRTLLLLRACGPDTPLVDVAAGARDEYTSLAGQFELSHYVQMIAMLEELRRSVRSSGAGRALTDALVVRFAHMRSWAAIEQVITQLAPAAASAEKKKSVADEPAGQATAQSTPAAAEQSAAADGGAAPRENGVRRESLADVLVRAATAASAAPSADAWVPGERDEEPVYELPEQPRPDAREAADDRPPATGGILRVAVAGEERRLVERDPVVRQALELFHGMIMDVTRPVRPAAVEESE